MSQKLQMQVDRVDFSLKSPFAITGYVFTASHAVHVTLKDGQFTGRGEGNFVYYVDEDADDLAVQLEAVKADVEAGASRLDIQSLMPRGGDEALEGYSSPVPLGADESCLHTGELGAALLRYDVINIKLDKAGGLTEALKIAELTQNAGKELMVGNFMNSSLGLAPSFVIGLMCRFVDLDGALLLANDTENGLTFDGGLVAPPSPDLWG